MNYIMAHLPAGSTGEGPNSTIFEMAEVAGRRESRTKKRAASL
jgi:hypothetical protein